MSASALSTFAPELFRDRVTLVTGGGRGIGREIALAFARLGSDVVIASRNPDHLVPTRRDLEALGRQCLAMPTNIRDTDQVDTLIESALDRFGRIDFLINNAGGQFPARPFDISDNGHGMDDAVRKKLFASFFSTKGAKGTGLGLLVTRKLVQEHGGTIEVQSEVGVGTTFTIRFPFAKEGSHEQKSTGSGR